MEGLQLLTTVNTDFEADLIKQKLSEVGIESFVQSSDSDSMLPATEGVSVFVEPYDFEKASWMIGDPTDDLSDDMEVEN